jgi:hypothetical protein
MNFNEYENLCTNFLLVLFICKGIKLDENLLRQIHLDIMDYNAINIKSNIVINNLLESKVFLNLSSFDKEFVNDLKKKKDHVRKMYNFY